MSGSSTTATSQLQSSGMLSKEQLLHLFNRFTFLTSLPDVKNRIAEAVKDQQDPKVSGSSTTATSQLQSSGMLSKEQLLHLFNRFTFLTSLPDVKNRIAEAVKDQQEAVAATTAIQEEIFLEMGVVLIPSNDREEMACDEAELGPDEFTERMHSQQKLHEQQLEMLKHMRKFHFDDQSAILEKLRQQMENTNYEGGVSVLSSEQIQEIVQRRVSPLFSPR
ncbi:hypothetical protein CFP56_005668 [Quercus suber]|uniref:Uncharacterized protein n=1 Tax=Quercus suber TaxID=58331 RepID=A0AAW0L8F4_QUESU